jgi:glycerol 2-dehydrogenase (NADP+)
VAYALSLGYRHIDAAYCYGNEAEVGQGIADAVQAGHVKREDLFVTTKLWCTYHTRVEQALDKSLESLGLEYVDLFLMHWPVAMNPEGSDDRFPRHADGARDLVLSRSHVDTYRDMEKLLATGKTKAIGVANYSTRYLDELLSQVTVVPAVNQIENHPLLPQREIVDLCSQKGIHVTAYSPLGSSGSPLMSLATIKRIAEKRNAPASTVLLGWHGMHNYLR